MSWAKRLGNLAPRLKPSELAPAPRLAARSARKSSSWLAVRLPVPRVSMLAVSAPRPWSLAVLRPSPPGQAMDTAM